MDKPAKTLSRRNWIDFALQKLTNEGIDKVSIAVLARELSVTKGSFYWHFKNREDLLQAMPERWKKTGSEIVFSDVDRVPVFSGTCLTLFSEDTEISYI